MACPCRGRSGRTDGLRSWPLTWLDCAPGEEGQAALLNKLQPIPAADWERLLAASAQGASRRALQAAGDGEAPAVSAGAVPQGDPRAFLLSVMNDPGVELALRIEAARVLLAHG